MNKPMIAVTARLGFYDGQNRIFDNQTYFEAVTMAGGIPVMVTYGSQEDYRRIAEQFDGLLVTGGEDLDSALFQQPMHPSVTTTDARLDELDLCLIRLFAEAGKPILGICRGIQCINVAFGGTLIQDLNTQWLGLRTQGHEQHKMNPKRRLDETSHEVTMTAGTQLEVILGPTHEVNSFHHQSVDQLAEGFIVSAISTEDGVIEGMERGNILAVQWHPERLVSDAAELALFQHLIHACAQHS